MQGQRGYDSGGNGVGGSTGVSLEAEHADDAVYDVVCQFKISLPIGDGAMFE